MLFSPVEALDRKMPVAPLVFWSPPFLRLVNRASLDAAAALRQEDSMRSQPISCRKPASWWKMPPKFLPLTCT